MLSSSKTIILAKNKIFLQSIITRCSSIYSLQRFKTIKFVLASHIVQELRFFKFKFFCPRNLKLEDGPYKRVCLATVREVPPTLMLLNITIIILQPWKKGLL